MTTPEVQYGLLAPMLIVFSVAVLGVLVEAFVPLRARRITHLGLALAGLVAALAAILGLAGTEASAMSGAVAIDGPTLFLQGTIVLVSIPAIALMAERTVAVTSAGAERRIDSFTPQASTTPGSVAEKEAIDAGVAQTEVFPLAMFAIGGMLLFPAATDLLTMFVALEVLSLPLYLLCGLARRRRLLSQEAALKYFLLGAFSSAFFLFGVAFLYGYAGTVRLEGIADAIAADGQGRSLALILPVARDSTRGRGITVQSRCRAVPFVDSRRLPGRPHAGDGTDGHSDQGCGVRCDSAHLRDGAARSRIELATDAVGRRHRDDGGGIGCRGDADRCQTDAGVLVRRAHRIHPHRSDGTG
jgi:NADH:ubiquinone oxidoreductase subunit 2 (subunit N)